MPERHYILDANVFIEAENRHYGFGICPGFWKLIAYHGRGRALSLRPVREELLTESLIDWSKHGAPPGFFHPVDAPEVVAHYAAMMDWVQKNTQFRQPAKEKFAREADCWLAAYAKAHGPDWVVVTEEEYAPEVKKKVPLPNLCRVFDIPYMDTVSLVRELQGAFDWNPAPDLPPERLLRTNPDEGADMVMEAAKAEVHDYAASPDDLMPDFFDDEPGE